MKVQNKVIVVTGGGSGMGREIVLHLLSKGARVVAIDINEPTLQETAALASQWNKSLSTFAVDITKKASVEKLLGDVLTSVGPVDGIINNAGIIQPFVKIDQLGYEVVERVFNVNFYGTLYMTKTFLPHLLTRPEAHIVNVSSMGGFLPVPGQTIYGASKAAVKLFTEGLHSELADTRVRVTIVFPGAVKTSITQNSGVSTPHRTTSDTKSMKVLSADKAAEIIIEGMENDRYRVLVGNDAKMMDWYYRFNPASAARMIAQKMKSLLAI
ncbi:SDR family oxidoreductase [Telluribacter sp. SYSU D00476]|uniref:SDR family NAD(P)-dependent oxidoreductase n=2 Tax=Pseudomonadati TaxID=3379134 RepID=UPI001FF44C06|nr:SDR family oxidoreductase [Telluribacter sp. SYSU D00476]